MSINLLQITKRPPNLTLKEFIDKTKSAKYMFKDAPLDYWNPEDLANYISYNDTENLENAFGLFYHVGGNSSGRFIVPEINLSKCKNIGSLFYDAKAVKSFPLLDLSNVEMASSAFYRMSGIDKNINYYDMFSNMPKLELAYAFIQWTPFKIEGEALHFPAMIDPYYMFNCCELTSIPKVYFSEKCTQLYATFKQAEKLTGTLHIPQRLTNEGEGLNCVYAFDSCYLVEEIIIDYLYVTDCLSMFYKCNKVKTIKTLDMRKCNRAPAFTYSLELETLIIKFINYNLSVSYNTKLTYESLIGLCKECVSSSTTRTLTLGATNLEKIANTYVRLTNETEEEPDYPKLPCKVCDSTDEGAMLISDYMALKNWTLS